MKIISKNHVFRRPLTSRPSTDTIVIHHSAGYDMSSEEVHRMHRNRQTSNGTYWIGIGYHYIIRQNGDVEEGRPVYAIGAHAGSSINRTSIGVCLMGDFDREKSYPTQEQMESLYNLIIHLFNRYGELEIKGHRDYMATACPGKNVSLEEIRKEVKQRMSMSNQYKIKVNGEKEVAVPIDNKNDRLYILLDGEMNERHWVQLRSFVDAFGFDVEWDGETNTANIITK